MTPSSVEAKLAEIRKRHAAATSSTMPFPVWQDLRDLLGLVDDLRRERDAAVGALKVFPTQWLDKGILNGGEADAIRIRMSIVGTSFETEITVADLRSARAILTPPAGGSDGA